MNIPDNIERIMQAHLEVINANPMIASIDWKIDEIPYRELEAWREAYNSSLSKHLQEADYLENTAWMHDFIRIYYRPRGYSKLCITLQSTKVTIKTTVEIIDK